MVSKVRGVVAWFLLVIFLLAACLVASEMGVAWYRRWQASRILACVKQMRPGVTTEAQARAELKRFAAYRPCGEGVDERARQEGYLFWNGAEWFWKLASQFPASWAERVTLPWTIFSVDVRYRDGLLVGIDIDESQTDAVWMNRPTSAIAEVLWSRAEDDRHVIPVPKGFGGYAMFSRSGVMVDQNGNSTGSECCRERFVILDERASAAQVAASENFQLRCMTSFRHCRSDRDILP
jgi:hypothetical protein